MIFKKSLYLLFFTYSSCGLLMAAPDASTQVDALRNRIARLESALQNNIDKVKKLESSQPFKAPFYKIRSFGNLYDWMGINKTKIGVLAFTGCCVVGACVLRKLSNDEIKKTRRQLTATIEHHSTDLRNRIDTEAENSRRRDDTLREQGNEILQAVKCDAQGYSFPERISPADAGPAPTTEDDSIPGRIADTIADVAIATARRCFSFGSYLTHRLFS